MSPAFAALVHPVEVIAEVLPDRSVTDRDAPAYSLRPQRADYWRDRGAADAMVRLMMTGLLRPSATYAEVCRSVGIPDSAARDAVSRFKNRARPAVRRANAPHPAPTGTKWCGYGGHYPPLPDFATNKTSTTGYQSWCRGCMVLARREQRKRESANHRLSPAKNPSPQGYAQGCTPSSTQANHGLVHT